MQKESISPPTGAGALSYSAEIRFGVVMYGGVSLAIYINGVTNELFEMACATPREGVRIGDANEPFTREIYRRLSWLIGSGELRTRYAEAIRQPKAPGQSADCWSLVDTKDCTQTRLAIDVIAGTSAGGINGIFLAKALANGQQFAVLKDLWVNEGDFALLLNDGPTYKDTDPVIVDRSAKPTSLLNSDRMYAKLQFALKAMAPLPGVAGVQQEGISPLVDEVDLYVTTTDIKGSAVPLRLFDKVVYERRFKQSYHFSYPNGATQPLGNDFDDVNTPFLAFAARCTSSFPFAFEPMTLAALTRLDVAGDPPGVLRWNQFFPNLPRTEVATGKHVNRAFGDGGYLDNKPFSYVCDALSRRFSSVPLERKLLFVEPSPEQLDSKDPNLLPDAQHPPDALENSLAALTSIPRYESIREDLQTVLARNRRIERIERVVWLGERNVRLFDPFSGVLVRDGKIPDWATLTLSDMVRYYGTAFLPYQRLRVYAVTDALADRVSTWWDIDPSSDQLYAFRALVRVWRDRNFDDERAGNKESVNAYLDQFDFDYRIRRLGFLLRKVDKLTRLFLRRRSGPLDLSAATQATASAFSEEEIQILADLPPPFTNLSGGVSEAQLELGEAILRSLKLGLLESRDRLLQVNRSIQLKLPTDESGSALRRDLNTILSEVLGEAPAGSTPEVQAKDRSGTTRVILEPEAMRMASATRTLQDAVMFRATALYDAAGKAAETPIQDWLLRGLEAQRLKPSGKDGQGGEPALHEASGLAWRILGSPSLTIEPDSNKVVAQVNASDTSGFLRVLPTALPVLNSPEGYALRRYFCVYYLRFDTFDQMSFPLYYDTGTGEPSTVEVVRVSPVDATNLIDEKTDAQRRRKLAGTALANFGAFLDRRWRLNDIMWGRLDGVERIIQALLPNADPDTATIRKELIERAQRSILREALVPDGNATLTDLVVKALDETPSSGTTAQQLQSLLAQLWTGNTVARERMSGLLVSLLSEEGLMTYVRSTRKVDPEPDPEITLKSAARAVTITGRVLEGVSKERGGGTVVPRWLARLGLMLQGIVAVSLPGTLNQRWWSHGVKVLYAFEVVLIVLALLLGSSDMRSLAITAFATTAGIHLVTLIVGDLVRDRRNHVVNALVLGLLLVLIGLAGIGALALTHQGAQQQLCWERPGDRGQPGAAGWMCDRLGQLQHWRRSPAKTE